MTEAPQKSYFIYGLIGVALVFAAGAALLLVLPL